MALYACVLGACERYCVFAYLTAKCVSIRPNTEYKPVLERAVFGALYPIEISR